MFDYPTHTIYSEHLYLENPDAIEITEHAYSTAGGDRRAWLNQLCLQAFLPWFREEIASDARLAYSIDTLPSFWEVVNGTAITFENYRLILIPTLAIDNYELRVPQEWLDIPEWIADYYVAVRVQPDDDCIEIYGYTTHYQLKTQGLYDWRDRTYSLESDDLIQDLNVLWVTHQTSSVGILRAEVESLSAVSSIQAENLLERLGNPELKFPRLAIPFSLWGALLARDNWRKSLFQLRQGISISWSIPQWLQTGVDNLAQQWGWSRKELTIAPVGMRSIETVTGVSRQLTIAGNSYELIIFPTTKENNLVWRFELQSTVSEQQIPVGFKLRLLTEALQPFENNEDIAIAPVDLLYLEVMLEPGEGLVWETEPEANNYRQETIRF
ncbi:DUF1822 family protein [Myxosarcina sp. GI1]|uniref:DUF1822 family protein n=1 Tax=Myxosarcina sp. GI1 TaxID=1541065 RepID=UPI0005628166|nr:DUF1822 family protein [Myxosarcina sp. GI1]